MKKAFIVIMSVLFLSAGVAFADGKQDYNARCAGCHGPNLMLFTKTAKALKVDPQKLSLRGSKLNKDEMTAVTEKGKDKMPAFEKQLSKEQIAGIINYIMAEKKLK
jgi:mono/diheme cytochrome c family protein